MNRLKNGLLVLGFLLIVGPSIGQVQEEKKTFNIQEAQEHAVNNNEKVLNAILDYQKADKRVSETVSTGLPQINFEGSFQNFLDIPTTVVDASFINPNAPAGSTTEFQMGTEYNTKGKLKVNQMVFNGSFFLGLKAAKNYKNFVKYSIKQSEEDIRYEVVKAYYNVLVAEKNISLLDSIILNNQKILEDIRAQYEAELIDEIQVDQLELSLAQAKTSHKRAERNVKISKNLLKFQMGIEMDKNIQLSDSLADFMATDKVLETQNRKFNVEENTDLVLMNKQRQLDMIKVKNQRADNYPSLNAFFNHSQSAQRNEFNFFDSEGKWFPSTVWGLSLNIPITSSGQRIFQTQQAKIDVAKDENNIKKLKRSLNLQESQARTNFQNAYDVVQTEKKNMATAKKIYKNTQIKKDNGLTGAMQLSQSQNQLISAQQSYIRAVSELLQAQAELNKITNQYKEELNLDQ